MDDDRFYDFVVDGKGYFLPLVKWWDFVNEYIKGRDKITGDEMERAAVEKYFKAMEETDAESKRKG